MITRLLAALAAAALPALAAQDPITCGGIGSDERHAMEDAAARSNIAIEMFIAPGGEYVADVDVVLRREGTGSGIAVHVDGPLCYLQVPAGRYRLEATFRGITRSRQVDAPATMGHPVRVSVAFPKSVGDTETDRASPEEKAQAASRP